MSYENQLIREATGQNRDFMEPEPEEPNDSNETGDQQVEMICENCGKPITSKFYTAQAGTRKVWHWSACPQT